MLSRSTLKIGIQIIVLVIACAVIIFLWSDTVDRATYMDGIPPLARYRIDVRRWDDDIAVLRLENNGVADISVCVLRIPRSVLTAVITLGSLCMTLALLRNVRTWYRLKGARCPNCGYDTRATPTRCPECGISRSGKRENRKETAIVESGDDV